MKTPLNTAQKDNQKNPNYKPMMIEAAKAMGTDRY